MECLPKDHEKFVFKIMLAQPYSLGERIERYYKTLNTFNFALRAGDDWGQKLSPLLFAILKQIFSLKEEYQARRGTRVAS